MKILITHASAGAGHTKAAEAIYNRLKEKGRDQLSLVDALDYTNDFYKKIYRAGYTLLITKLPWLWGFFFWVTAIPWLCPLVRFCRRFFNSLNAKRFHLYLEEEQFDFIVSTHFFPNEIASFLKKTNKIRSTIICVVTDYDVHNIWLAEAIDFYAVACEYTKQSLARLHVASDKAVITGIPTDKKFAQTKDVRALKAKLGVKEGLFTVLIATGSFGIGPIEEIVKELEEFQVLVVCGRNKSLFQRLKRQNIPQAKIFGLVDNMHELMAVSDCMVTKPGGLSISEALVSRLPLIFFNAIPGQEENNVHVLNTYGIGINSHGHVDIIIEELKKLARSQSYFQHTKEKINHLAFPQAVDNIVKII
ncbi:MAG: glycosyltransferase [Candidatus Omnitrophota bacterium]